MEDNKESTSALIDKFLELEELCDNMESNLFLTAQILENFGDFEFDLSESSCIRGND